MQDHMFVPVPFSSTKPVTMDKALVEVRFLPVPTTTIVIILVD